MSALTRKQPRTEDQLGADWAKLAHGEGHRSRFPRLASLGNTSEDGTTAERLLTYLSPTEWTDYEQIAADLGIHRTTAGNALLRLQESGIVERSELRSVADGITRAKALWRLAE